MRWLTKKSHRCSLRQRDRRGVLILVVLSLLVLFLMVGIAFVLTAGQFHSMSQRRSSARELFGDPQETIDIAMYQLLRDTTDYHSSIAGHSLLNDLYGNDGFIGTIASGANLKLVPNTGGLFINIPVATVEKATDGRYHQLSTTRGAYSGCVFTVVSGTEVGRSTRIVGYDGAGTLTVMAWETRNGRSVNVNQLANSRFVVNGRPFNGTGAGYNPSSGKGNLPDNGGSLQSALRPNRSRRGKLKSIGGAMRMTSDGELDRYFLGGMDEPYDAPDYQNMFLAFQTPMPSETDPNRIVIPSFHRPALFNYWQARGGNLVRATLRPLPRDVSGESYFTELPPSTQASGSLLKFHTGPWDVDNDGDGVRDSVWIDLECPDIVSPDGFQCRPLFAFMVLDLDGRINLNAAGNSSHLASLPTAVTLANGVSSSTAPRGEGVGPAEINLAGGTFAAPLLSATRYQALLQGNGNWPGKYGSGSEIAPGFTGQWEKTSQYNLFGIPANYFSSGPFSANLLGRPLDCRGRLAFGLDNRGAPVYEISNLTDDRVDSPYEIDLSWRAPRGAFGLNSYGGRGDAPFSILEQERLLRPYDRDSAGLPGRILDLAPEIASANLRHMYTTDSYSLDAPNTSFPLSVRNAGATYGTQFGSTAQGTLSSTPYSLADLLKQRLMTNGLDSTTANNEISKMIPPEVLRGERFNLNRLFGDGKDNNTNNVVDDPAETSDQLSYPAASGSVNANFDYSNGDAAIAASIRNTPLAAKQIFARHLFCLAMLLQETTGTTGTTVNIDFDGDSTNNTPAETIRGLAQWAINVADFRDSDSIMTPFEYDMNPFNGWNVDGDLTTSGESDRGVVWGAERPELLITETMAWHDRATEDTNQDPTTLLHAMPVDPTKPDTNFDQRYRPKGSAFIEVYNPWVGGDKYPAELYDNVASQPVLRLDKLSGGSTGSPVWRMLVVQGTSRESLATQDAITNNSNYNPESIATADIDRSIYFTTKTSSFSSISGHGTAYSPSTATNGSSLQPIQPGSYAVIGSKGRQGDSTSGFKSTAGVNPGNPYVILNPTSSAVANRVKVVGGTTTPPTNSQKTAVVIDTPRSFSISEPDGVSEPYYADTVTDPTDGTTVSQWTSTIAPEGEYVPPLDRPLDNIRATSDTRWQALMQDGTTQDFRTIHLQRLANPLLAWNATTNPYITIDVSSMNLTAFNGAPNATMNGPDPDVTTSSNNQGNFVSFQRGENETSNSHTFWRNEASALPTRGAALAAPTLDQTLGGLNQSYGTAGTDGFPSGNAFPWLTWNNRPFISPHELMLVPRSRASRLAFDYSALPATPSAGSLPEGYQSEQSAFGHLLNFFDSRPTLGTHLYRLFEYVGVPSRFAGVRGMLNPNVFGASTLPESKKAPAGFRAPLNFVSSQRVPGRINLNTINDANVWYAILGNHPGPTWEQFVASRRGYGAQGNDILRISPSVPTYFANPFRAFGSGDLVPLPSLEKQDIDATLLRSYPYPASAGMHSLGPAPLMQPQSSSAYNQADRNPYFRYQQASRISNLVTTQSNVYAVWVTMGYFTMGSIKGGLRREIGNTESGGVRHRAFYIIDRSIPVAFEPGVNHNVDDAILVRRMLD